MVRRSALRRRPRSRPGGVVLDPAVYLAFFAATAVMILLPGPSVMLTVAHALAYGWNRALITVAGATLGVAVQLAVALAGMASLMLLLAAWFEWLRWAGVAWLLWLGIAQWRAAPETPAAPESRGGGSLFLQGLVVTIPNPKSLLFLAAFLPQFVDPGRSLAVQFAIMTPTFLAITFVFTGAWAVAAHQARRFVRTRRAARLRNRMAAALLFGAGLGMALVRRG